MGDAAERSFVDLHCHSSASYDSLSDPARIVRAAAQRGLTHLAITDHERIDGAQRARDLAPDGLTVIVGEEIRSLGGDVIGLFLERAVRPGMPLPETVEAIHEQGGLAGLPHPFDRFRSSGLRGSAEVELDAIAAQLDYVEAFNARVPYGAANVRAAEFARAHGLPGVAASDAHSVLEVGIAYTAVTGSPESAAEMRIALANATLVTGRASFVVRAWVPAAKLVQRLRGNRPIRSAPVPGSAGR